MEKPDLTLFPAEPGVYLYKDKAGHILYIGKARRLRHRIASYFREESCLSPKTRSMLRTAVSIDILRTSTDKEALLLEASLIKKHRPRYNIVLRDDKEYLLFRIGSAHPYPRIEVVRRNRRAGKDAGARFFGPFASGSAARETWKLIHKYFPLRRCRDIFFANRTRPCLYYDIKQCLAPCVLPVPTVEYQAHLGRALLLLSGRSRELTHVLRDEMHRAAAALRFEEAARLRDQIKALEQTLERQSVVLSSGHTLDIVGIAQVPEGLALGVLFVRDGLLLDGRNFFWPGLTVEDTPELIRGFLTQYYLDRRGVEDSIPPRIVVPWLPGVPECTPAGNTCFVEHALAGENTATGQSCLHDFMQEDDLLHALESALSEIRGALVQITRPKGVDEDNLSVLAASNAREAVKNTIHTPLADLLEKIFGTGKAVRRIEVVDISHTSGLQTRAGMVVFEDENPVPGAFRTYSFDAHPAKSSFEAGDDYAALAAWAERRLEAGEPWPDLLLVDGGKGQLAAVQRVFAEAGAGKRFCMASIAKARTEDKRPDRRAGNVSDRIFIPGRSNPLNLQAGSRELLFLQRIRDTAHEYVINRHRQARAAATLTGELTRLPGIGPETARRLFAHFGSLAAMASAGENAFLQVPGIGRAKARSIAGRLAALMGNTPAQAEE
jgi:excinuclease ABC subunit C